MTTKCEALEETTTTSQAPESNQASMDDSSAKTIEFLRARLLSERAASKAARQQAQEIAEKVNDLNARLEMEIKSRKEAESTVGRVLSTLKARGLAVDALASTDLKDEGAKEATVLDDIKEMNKDPFYDKEVSPELLETKDERAEKGIIEEKKHSTREPHASELEKATSIVSDADQALETHCDKREALQQNVAAEHHHGQIQLDVTDKPMVYTDNMSPNCPPSVEDSSTAQAFNEGSSITLKLKAMLHQMGQEVAALPKEQPLKLQLQTWVDHVAGVLNMEKDLGLNGLCRHSLDGSCNPSVNYPLKEAKKDYAATLDQIHENPEGVDTKGGMGNTMSVVPKDMVQPSIMIPGLYHSTMYAPTSKDPALPPKTFHTGRSSYDAPNFSQPPPRHPQMMHPYGVSSQSYVASYAPLFANGYTANGDFTGVEAQYYIEAQSPRSSDVFLRGGGAGKMGYGHGQCWEAQSRGGGLGIEAQALSRDDAWRWRSEMWSQAGLGSSDMPSSPYIVDVSNEMHMKHDKYLNPQNIQLERGHAYSHRRYVDQVKNAAEFNMARHSKRFPVSDATFSLTDDKSGRLGDILLVLDTARQHVGDEEQSIYAEEQIFGPLTPRVEEEARRNRGYQYGNDMQQVAYEHLNHVRGSRVRGGQTPIIQFPPSPASEHGYSPFERHGRHRRSSSVSANFMMSGWDGYPQSRGEVELGNGITLYTE